MILKCIVIAPLYIDLKYLFSTRVEWEKYIDWDVRDHTIEYTQGKLKTSNLS